MRSSRRAVAAAVSVSITLVTGVAVAHADGSSVLYVDNVATANCTDTGGSAGSAATPFCTIQAAADAAIPGDTIEIADGRYAGGVDIKSVGTAAAPIVFEAIGGTVQIVGTGSTGPALTFDGASNVTFGAATGLIAPSTQMNVWSVGVIGSSHITLDNLRVTADSPLAGVEIAGSSSDVSLTRSLVLGSGGGVLVDTGSSGDVISTNGITSLASGIEVEGASDTAVTSNNVTGQLHTGHTAGGQISVSAGSTGTSIENNVVANPAGSYPAVGGAIYVDASSAPGTTSDYNVEWPTGLPTKYVDSWAGVDYQTAASFTAATSQGSHDLVANPQLYSLATSDGSPPPQTDSANSAAPGMLSTDRSGMQCYVDPVVPITGAGSPDYCSRGFFQQRYATTVNAPATPIGALSVSLGSSVSQVATGNEFGNVPQSPTPAISYVINWGDGTTSAPIPGSSTEIETTATHAYAKAGTYPITDTAQLTDGTTISTTTSFTTAGSTYTPHGPTRILDTRNGTGAAKAKVPVNGSITVQVAGADSIPSDISAVALNLTVTDATGNGYLSVVPNGQAPTTSNLNYAAGQTVANSVIVPVHGGGITIYNSGTSGSADIIADVSGYFTPGAGNGYTAASLDRILDTRNGTGAARAQVAANSGIPVTIAGADAIPSGITAVAVHVTVADTTGNGWIAAEPDGADAPSTSVLNYGKGQIISNTVIVPVAADGKIELYNGGGTTPVDLIADVSGYFSAGSAALYMPIDPVRAFDSRYGSPSLPANGAQAYDLGLLKLPSMEDVIANITLTQETKNGYITAYPTGTAKPTTSNLNYAPGQTIGGMFILSTPSTGEVDVYNQSGGTAQIILDVFGYFTNA